MKQFFYILSFIFLVSCTSRTIYKKPDDLIPKDKMIELWTDIYIANSASSIKKEGVNENSKINYMPFIAKKYNIDSARFMRSNIYYTSRIEDYEKMFLKVEENLRLLKDKFDPDMVDIDPSIPIDERDSIRKVRKKEKNKAKRDDIKAQVE